MLGLARKQAENSGAEVREEDVLSLEVEDAAYGVEMENGERVRGRALVLAMGISRNTLGLTEEKAFVGKGVSYCVDCDAPLYRDEPVAVAGCGSAAVSGALTMVFYTPEVHLVCEGLDVGENLARSLRESDIVLHEGRNVAGILGDAGLSGIVLDDGTELSVSGLFIEMGAKGAVELAGSLGIFLDESMKYIAVNKKQETNLPGVYAAGDICGPPWQVAKSVGEGCVAGMEAAAYARKTGKAE
jgi:thioredoxin reductase (NADPH)